MRGETLVTVSDRDVNGVSISLAPAVTVQGITRVMGAPIHMKQMPGFERARAAAGADADVDDADFDQAIESSCDVCLHEIGGGTHNPSAPARRLRPMSGDPESGAFTIADVLPRRLSRERPVYWRVSNFGAFGGSRLAGEPESDGPTGRRTGAD